MTATGARSAAPPDELVARFRAALERLWPDGGKLGLAVSGGPDSLAMLLLAEAAIPGQFEVATVDHGLRPEAADECAMVARVCAERGVPCEVLNVTLGPGNVQATAREARYEALAEWGELRDVSAVATAHHADDQAETLLMRLNRGSGLSGLAGVREQGLLVGSIFMVPAIRPLLRFRRAELASVIEGSGLTPVNDPSNSDDRFDRARIRKALGDSPWLDPLALADSAAHLAEVGETLEWLANREWTARVVQTDDHIRFRRGSRLHGRMEDYSLGAVYEALHDRAPRAVVFEVIKQIMRQFDAEPRGKDLARLLDRLEAGEGGNVAGVLATVEGDDWLFRREPPRRTG